VHLAGGDVRAFRADSLHGLLVTYQIEETARCAM
jgi:hypothetical protein